MFNNFFIINTIVDCVKQNHTTREADCGFNFENCTICITCFCSIYKFQILLWNISFHLFA